MAVPNAHRCLDPGIDGGAVGGLMVYDDPPIRTNHERNDRSPLELES